MRMVELQKSKKKSYLKKLTKAFVETFGRGEKTCVVTIDEISTDNYAIGGETITNIRKGN